MGGNRAQGAASSRGQWFTLVVTTGATAALVGFQAFLTCTGPAAQRAARERQVAARSPALAATAPRAAPPRPPRAGSDSIAGPVEPTPAIPIRTASPPDEAASTQAAELATRAAARPSPPAPERGPVRAEDASGASAAGADARPAPVPGWIAADEGYRLERAGDLRGAARALERARALGYRPQQSALDIAALARAMDDGAAERQLLAEAAAGPDASLAAEARAALRDAWLGAAWRRRARGDLAGARAALEAARAAGADPQRLAVELAYVDLARGSSDLARARLLAAADGADAAVASQARAQLAALPRKLRVDLYSEVLAWDRVAGADPSGATVPMVRLRLRWRPWLERALDLYAFAQGTREVGPIAERGGAPVLHADDASFAGGGVLVHALDGHAGLFAQVGPAIATAPGRAGRVALDARAGAFLDLSAGRCWPAPADGLRAVIAPCAEGYGEATYVSRLRDDVFGLARLRGGVTLLVAGPVALGLVTEGRAAVSTNRDWYDQLADVGAGLRARLLAPFHLDLSATAVAGRYLGIRGRDPAPSRLSYVDLRVQAATFVEF